jgi:hypothetical protein
MTDTFEQAQARGEFEAKFQESVANLERLRAAFAELERQNHTDLTWALEKLQRVEAAHQVLVNAMSTNDDIDLAELRGFLKREKKKNLGTTSTGREATS